jgi:branched-subunit amino acid aminotransferase/4-amino-4-deoxychorismate lyase
MTSIPTLPADAIPSDDRGFTLGDGLFETLLVEDGAIRFWDEHMQRLAAGCATLGLPTPDPDALAAAGKAAIDDQPGRRALRISVTAGGGGRGLDRPAVPTLRIVATCAPAPAPSGPVSLVTASVRRNERSPASRLKTLAYIDSVLARAEARGAGADEAVMLNTRDEVACAAAANLFWLAEGRLFTPALDCGALDGIMGRRLLEAAERLAIPSVRVRAGPEALVAAEAVLITNSLICVRAALSLDGRVFASSALADRLIAAI